MEDSTLNQGLLAWKRTSENGTPELYLKEPGKYQWVHYSVSKFKRPDLLLRGASKGYTTAQYLVGLGWNYTTPDKIFLQGTI